MTLNRRDAVLVFGTVLGGLAAASPARAATEAEQAVADAVDRLRQLMLKPERAALEALMSPDLTYGHSDRRVQDRAEVIGSLVTGRSRFNAIILSDQTVRVLDDLAVVRHRFQADAVSNGNATQPDIRVLQVWQKGPQGWVLLVRQAH